MMTTTEKHLPVSQGLCFWCGEPDGTILMGKRLMKKEAPRYAISGYGPCETCQNSWSKGIVVIEVSQEPNTPKQPPLSKKQKLYPTSRVAVVKEEGLLPMLQEDAREHIAQTKRMLVSPTTFADLFTKPEGSNEPH